MIKSNPEKTNWLTHISFPSSFSFVRFMELFLWVSFVYLVELNKEQIEFSNELLTDIKAALGDEEVLVESSDEFHLSVCDPFLTKSRHFEQICEMTSEHFKELIKWVVKLYPFMFHKTNNWHLFQVSHARRPTCSCWRVTMSKSISSHLRSTTRICF
jgi:hypothetical protein